MTQWSHDISAAPRGEEKLTTISVDGKQRTKREYHVAPVWLAWADGSVSRSYWVPETKAGPARWSGCTAAQVPIAWQHFVVPEHPFTQRDGANAGGSHVTPGRNAHPQPSAVEPVSSSTEFYLEDAGSGA
ncbi:hypothetical protein HRR99_03140 [Agrobacterium vaccinii]|uniref:hypothetical protein n=1 Tax=Agrobacterium vaccinii TaxID=2735528 RepID=UPI001E6252E7|nr:hypothetical protein [Agrobacterium vaccinii]UHS60584.1 hypothetical protein HRR99_03140 [Agrobacterium vaccinii]